LVQLNCDEVMENVAEIDFDLDGAHHFGNSSWGWKHQNLILRVGSETARSKAD
jgi:hypothetical protein